MINYKFSLSNILIIFLVLCCTSPLFAENSFSFDMTAWGIGGIGTYSITESSFSSSELYYYIGCSVYFVFHVSNYLAIQPGLAYINETYDNGSYNLGTPYNELSLTSISIPLYIRYTSKDEETYMYGGSIFKLLMEAKANASVDVKNQLGPFGITAVIGAGIVLNNFFFDLSLSYNLLNFTSVTTIGNKPYIGFNIGLIFWSQDRP